MPKLQYRHSWKALLQPLILFLQKEVILMLAHSSSFDEFLLPINVGAQASKALYEELWLLDGIEFCFYVITVCLCKKSTR